MIQRREHDFSAGEQVRVALVSDTHGTVDARIAEVVAGCDLCLHAGDIGSARVLERLDTATGVVVAVRGNNDAAAKWPADEEHLLEQLPFEARLRLPGGELVLVHGHRAGGARDRHLRLRARYPEARAIVYGHSHRLACDTDQAPWVLNPGAAGRTRTYGGPSCMVLHARAGEWEVEALRFEPVGRGR